MTEKELKEFNKSTDGLAHDLPEQQSPDQWIGLAFLNFMKFNKHFADATRQLTIANQIAHMRSINELRAQQGLAVAYPEESFDKVFGDKSSPADGRMTDALVDRLAGLLQQAQGKITHRDMPLYTEVESALEIYRAGYQTVTPKTDDALVEAFQILYHDRCYKHDEDCSFYESHEFCSKCSCGDNHDHRKEASKKFDDYEAAHKQTGE